MNTTDLVILKIGGSLLSISDEEPFNFDYAYKLRTLVTELVRREKKLIINVGGGFLARKFMKLVDSHGERDVIDIHKVGVAATNMNAEILHGLFDKLVSPEVLRYADFDEFLTGIDTQVNLDTYSGVISSGSKPGKSNDWNALQFAYRLKSKIVISIKNIDGVYTADPKKDPDAKRLDGITWDQYLEIIGNPKEHRPGASYPVDPISARDAKQKGISFWIMGGDLGNLRKAILEGQFVGTVIQG